MNKEELENQSFINMEKKRLATKLKVDSSAFREISRKAKPFRRIQNTDRLSNKSMSMWYRESLGVPIIWRKTDGISEPADCLSFFPNWDTLEYGIVFPFRAAHYWVDLPANYPEFGMSLIDIDNLFECDHCGKMSLGQYTCEDCGKNLCYGCWIEYG